MAFMRVSLTSRCPVVGVWAVVAGEPQVITKHCGNELFLSDEQLRTNATISHYRQRVEQVSNHRCYGVVLAVLQVIRQIKSHAIFRGNFRGGTRLLAAMVRVVVHATARQLRFHPKYNDAPCGPWPHHWLNNYFLSKGLLDPQLKPLLKLHAIASLGLFTSHTGSLKITRDLSKQYNQYN